MDGAIKTLKQARNYAANILAMTGKTHLIFKVPQGTYAHEIGYRFGTCELDERADYEADGAEFLD